MNTKEKTQLSDKPISALEILTTEYPEPNNIIPGLLPVGLSIVAGRPKIGKSWLALQLAVAVGSGINFFGRRVEQRSVLYVAYEDNERRIKERLTIQEAPTENLLVNFFPLEIAQEEFSNLNDGGSEKIADLISNDGYGFVLIDTLSNGIRGDYNDNDEMTKALTPMREIAQNANVGIMFVDHHRKARNSGSNLITDILGATAKAAVIDTVWGLYESRGNHILQIAGRDVLPQEYNLTFNGDNCIWEVAPQRIVLTELQQNILSVLRAHGKLNNKDIADILGKDKSNLHGTLTSLWSRNILDKEPDGDQFLYSIIE